jgi:hypothetical protein
VLLTVIFLNALRDGFNFTLLTVCSSELKTSHLEGYQSIAELNDVNQTVEVVRCQYKAVPLCHWTPASYGHDKSNTPTNKTQAAAPVSLLSHWLQPTVELTSTIFVRAGVSTAVTMKNAIIWDVALCESFKK